MGEWTTASVEDVAARDPRAIAIGPFGSAMKADVYTPTGMPVVRGQDIREGKALDTSDRVFVPDSIVNKFAACVVRKGDLVFPHRGAIGRVGIVGDEELMLSSSMMKLSVDRSRMDPLFVFYYFRGPGKPELLARTSTVGTPGIAQPLSSLRSIPIRFPSLEEQRAIAEALGALDDKIAANDRVITAADEMMVVLASSSPRTVSVLELADHRTKSVKPETFDAEVAHFSLPAFDDGQIPATDDAGSIKSNKFALTDPCVLISKLNPRIPRIWDVPVVPRQMAVASTEFVMLVPRTTSTSALWAALKTPAVSAALQGLVAGTSGSHQRVKPAELLALSVPDPRALPADVQDQLANLGSAVNALRSEKVRLAATRDELLPLLMSGKLRVKDAEQVAGEVS
ncbi:restriction endonuclease subunit S [Nocardioides sp. DS6]|uniref:Restriction endonuclease subunit S n=1 Tax=Nocardioides eburneus TaxID=3231482 RepID=A0ABV3T1X0_9ACTN